MVNFDEVGYRRLFATLFFRKERRNAENSKISPKISQADASNNSAALFYISTWRQNEYSIFKQNFIETSAKIVKNLKGTKEVRIV